MTSTKKPVFHFLQFQTQATFTILLLNLLFYKTGQVQNHSFWEHPYLLHHLLREHSAIGGPDGPGQREAAHPASGIPDQEAELRLHARPAPRIPHPFPSISLQSPSLDLPRGSILWWRLNLQPQP